MLVKLLDTDLYASDLTRNGAFFEPKHASDAGIDLRATKDVTVHAGVVVVIPLGVAVGLPALTVGWLTGRSSTAIKRGLFVHEGKIDSGYTGEIHCFCTSTGSPVEIERGDRICQLVVLKIEPPVFRKVESIDNSDRGSAGLGSTGLK